MQSARRSACSTSPESTKPCTRTTSPRPSSATRRSTSGRSGPSPNTSRRRSGARSRSAGIASTSAGTRFSGMWLPGEHQRRLRGLRTRPLERAGVLAEQELRLAAQALAPEPLGMEAGEAEGPLGHACAEQLHRVAEPAGTPEVLAPVVARPHLVPVHHQAEAAEPPHRGRREQREVGERGRVHHVVVPAVAEQVRQHPGAEHERRGDPPAPVAVEVEARAHRHHAHAGHLGLLGALPLAEREVGDRVAVPREPLPSSRYQRSAPPTVYGNRQS